MFDLYQPFIAAELKDYIYFVSIKEELSFQFCLNITINKENKQLNRHCNIYIVIITFKL